MVPKAITFTLVNHSKENLQRELLQELYKPDVLDDLLRESEHVVARRREVITTLAALNKADEYVHQANCGALLTCPQDHLGFLSHFVILCFVTSVDLCSYCT